MNIQIKLDLYRYTVNEIISLVEDGVITVKEVRESGIVSTFFNNSLEKFLSAKEKKNG